jgi:peptidoglycan/LPS O-acetylase OafA/YrhL
MRLRSLDALRGLAVLAVILFHAQVLPLGWVGVDLFFVLSGWLITGILLDAKAAGPSFRAYATPFYLRRSVRILPLAWVAVLLVGLGTGLWAAGWYGSFLINWWMHPPQPRSLAHFWTLAVEEQFYLVWPIVVFVCSRRQLARVSVAALVLFLLARAGAWYVLDAETMARIGNTMTITRADGLVSGAWLAALGSVPAFPWMGIVSGAAWLMLETGRSGGAVAYVLQPLLLAIAFTALVRAALTTTITAPRWLVHLGTISYGLYVMHGIVSFYVLPIVLQPWKRVTAIMVLSLVLAELSWLVLERPMLRFKNRWPMPRPADERFVPTPHVDPFIAAGQPTITAIATY